MKKWIITVSTDWCGMENIYKIEAESETELEELADQIAIDNWESYSCLDLVAEELDYDTDNLSAEDWDKVWDEANQNPSWHYTIEEFTGTEEEWDQIEHV